MGTNIDYIKRPETFKELEDEYIELYYKYTNLMRKYQKIQDIIEYHMLRSLPKKNMSGFQKDILEVLEDGNDD